MLGVGCAANTAPRPDRAPTIEKTVAYVDGAVSPQDPRWSPWYRVADDFDLRSGGAFYFAVATDGTACLIPGRLMPLLYRGARLACELGQWRMQGRNPFVRQGAYQDTSWVRVSASDGSSGHIRLPAARTDSTVLVLLRVDPAPADTVLEIGVVELDCGGRVRYPHDALFNARGQVLTDQPVMTWDSIVPGTVAARIELLACPPEA